MYINVGARNKSDETDIPTKSALKRIFAENPGNVVLYETTLGREDKTYNSDTMDIGDKYSVTGPNPYKSRKWYATVEKVQSGRITVK